MTRPNFFSEAVYDRAATFRTDDGRLASWLEVGRFVPVWRDMVILEQLVDPRALFAGMPQSGLVDAGTGIIFLGLHGDEPYFAVDISLRDDGPAMLGGEAADLREIGGHLRAEEASLLAHARAMVYWHARHRFCGVHLAASRPWAGVGDDFLMLSAKGHERTGSPSPRHCSRDSTTVRTYR